jgi:uncharacterized YccA/Bax inhibitor family protein
MADPVVYTGSHIDQEETLESRNPVLSRPGVWSPNEPQSTHPQQPGYAQPGYGQPGYPPGAPVQGPQGYGMPAGAPQEPVTPSKGVMTLDDVVIKTGILFAILAVTAAATWMLTPPTLLLPLAIIASLAGLVTVVIVSFRRKVSPAAVFLYAVVEGVFIGAFSKVMELMYTGIVAQAILATFVAAGVTFAVYKVFRIRVTATFQKVVYISTISFAVLIGINLVLALLGVDTGLRSFGSGAGLLSMGISAIAIVLATLNLILDFDHIERGIAMRAPAEQSWIAAFGLMVTMVWLYIEMLRILSYFRN